ncbi:neuropeptide FF receptor 2-like [Branchiostoma floridae]|uniref:Neuropeptide FF receptor 2-like n=1 Tax=Branchiostoma floridae TaxID=7739 RepID=A0A9J7KVP3_BRAFL|nr:neuropeptide FF receptor 2-like [Branchiostoma floridae]
MESIVSHAIMDPPENSTDGGQVMEDEQIRLKQTLGVVVVFVVAYILLFIVCVIGNSLVCLVIAKIPRMRTVTNFYILNLAVGDLLVGIFSMPFTLADNIIMGWPFGYVMCKLSSAATVISAGASVFTLIAIAVDRFYAVIHPNEPKFTSEHNGVVIAIIWALAVIFAIPQVVVMDTRPYVSADDNSTYTLCVETWPNYFKREIYTVLLFVILYMLPLCIIGYLYLRVGFKVWCRPVPGGGERNNASRRKYRTIKMLLVVVVCFAVSWLPIHTVMLINDCGNPSIEQRNIIYYYVFPIAHWFSYLQSSINPVIYGYFNRNYRRGFTEFSSTLRRTLSGGHGVGRRSLPTPQL